MTDLWQRHFTAGPPRLFVRIGPTAGPPLLLLHGVTRNGQDWEILLPHLTQHFTVYLLDHRGHGQSAHVSNAYLVRDYAADVLAVVQELFTTPVTLLGHSLGAMVALAVAATRPTAVSRLILEDPPFHTMGQNIAGTAYQVQFAGMQAVARQGGTPATLLTGLSAIELPTPSGPVRLDALRDRAALEFSATCLAQLDPEIFTPLVAGAWLNDFDYPAFWPKVECPTLLLQADAQVGGTFTDAEVTAALAKLKHGQVVFFPCVGHQIHRSVPEKFLTTLQQWFAMTM